MKATRASGGQEEGKTPIRTKGAARLLLPKRRGSFGTPSRQVCGGEKCRKNLVLE